MKNTYVIGLDFGSDSVRALLVETKTGKECAEAVFEYPRWKKGLYCVPAENQFRQHPLDYMEGLEYTIKEVLKQVPGSTNGLKAIAFDTTGSTPCLVDKKARPLALQDRYSENPNAMFMLWKDHTAMEEAAEINRILDQAELDFRIYSGGDYSSEWIWAKSLHALRADSSVREEAYAVIEHCDWIAALLTGVSATKDIKMSRCSAGHKAMWAKDWDGFPSLDFFESLDPQMRTLVENLQSTTYTCDEAAGTLCEEWAAKLGLSTDVLVGIGNTDAHAGALGAGVRDKVFVQNIGTSMCCMAVTPYGTLEEPIKGISGQVDDSIVPGMVGYEAGLSAFGDVYAWYKKMLLNPILESINQSNLLDAVTKEALKKELGKNLLNTLSDQAASLELNDKLPVATDWLNGRRNPFLNYSLRATVTGLNLSSSAAEIFYSLVEATCFGIKTIVDYLFSQGIEAETIIGTGGIPQKSPFVMQTLANVLGLPVEISGSTQSGALGSAMFAATVAGCYTSVSEAQQAFKLVSKKVYYPDESAHATHVQRYQYYQKIGGFTEQNSLNDKL